MLDRPSTQGMTVLLVGLFYLKSQRVDLLRWSASIHEIQHNCLDISAEVRLCKNTHYL